MQNDLNCFWSSEGLKQQHTSPELWNNTENERSLNNSIFYSVYTMLSFFFFDSSKSHGTGIENTWEAYSTSYSNVHCNVFVYYYKCVSWTF